MAEVSNPGTTGVEVVAPRSTRDTAERPKQPQSSEPSPERNELDEALTVLRNAAAATGSSVSFNYDREREQIVVLVKEAGTDRVLRQIPSEEALRLAQIVRCGQQRLLDKLV